MAVVRWSPFEDVFALHRSLGDLIGPGVAAGFAVDVQETAEDLVLRADLPGVRPEDVSVEVADGVLTVTASRDSGWDAEARGLVRERRTGRHQRRFTLPAEVDAAGIVAEAADGVLTVRLPKAAAARPRQIPVQAAVR